MDSLKFCNSIVRNETINEVEKNNVLLFSESNFIELHCVIPEGMYISKGKIGNSIFSSKHFKRGELVYRGKYNIIDKTNFSINMHLSPFEDPNKKETFSLNFTHHTVSIGNNKRVLYFFDSFMNHCCIQM
jgi:hypothetical protein